MALFNKIQTNFNLRYGFAQAMVMEEICDCLDKNGICEYTINDLVERTHRAESTVHDAIRALKRLGILIAQSTAGFPNMWYVAVDKLLKGVQKPTTKHKHKRKHKLIKISRLQEQNAEGKKRCEASKLKKMASDIGIENPRRVLGLFLQYWELEKNKGANWALTMDADKGWINLFDGWLDNAANWGVVDE